MIYVIFTVIVIFLTEKIFLISMIFMEWYLGNEVTENSYSPSVLGMLESIEVCMKRSQFEVTGVNHKLALWLMMLYMMLFTSLLLSNK